MTAALIGHTGFVGGNLQRQTRFDAFFNSKNIETIAGRRFDLLVCAGAPAEKWKANQNPEADRENLQRLQRALESVQALRVVLISTVDVYPVPSRVDESVVPDLKGAMPYGLHRRELELFFEERFRALIIRMPGLFGVGLKKNVIYDLLHHNRLEAIHADGQFQYYALDRLWNDIQVALKEGWRTLHLTSEPVQVHEVAQVAFGVEFENRRAPLPTAYDVRSRYAKRLGGGPAYLRSKTQILNDIRAFVRRQTAPMVGDDDGGREWRR